jgi:hypothetical protein
MSNDYYDPSGTVRSCWVGREVEGRLKGLLTLFVLSVKDLATATSVNSYPHVYLCPTSAQNDEAIEIERAVASLVDAKVAVTVAVKPKDAHKLTPYVRVNAHIMVDIDAHGLTWLKPTDTLKVEVAPYTTYACSVEQTVESKPEDYANDYIL